MTEIWVGLAGVVGAAIGWFVGQRATTRGAVVRGSALVAVIVVLLVTDGLPQRVAAAAGVGLVLADAAAGVVRRRRGQAVQGGAHERTPQARA